LQADGRGYLPGACRGPEVDDDDPVCGRHAAQGQSGPNRRGVQRHPHPHGVAVLSQNLTVVPGVADKQDDGADRLIVPAFEGQPSLERLDIAEACFGFDCDAP
jgi:hypothetical protein